MSPNPFLLLDTHVKLTKNTLQALQYGNMQFEKNVDCI